MKLTDCHNSRRLEPAFALRLGAALLAALAIAAPLAGQAAAAPAPTTAGGAPTLSIDEAVATALAKDPGVISANLDWLSAKSKADSASWKRLPSLSASMGGTFFTPLAYVTPPSGYSFLGEVPDAKIDLSSAGFGVINLTPADHYVSLGVNLQYPLYDGGRVKENIAIATLQIEGKDIARESVRRSLAFDVQRAYWEAVRATYNIATLEQNQDLMRMNSELASRQLSEGVATRADQLAAEMRLDQATQDLNDARSQQKRAFLSLASLTGADLAALGISTAADDAQPPFALSTKPDESVPAALSATDEAALISGALVKRPETRTAELARKLAEHTLAVSKAALLPTVALTGGLIVATPNQRDQFDDSSKWVVTTDGSIGLQVNYDIGGVPAALDDIKAQTLAASKAKSDEVRQRNAVVMDVENCIVNLERAVRDLGSIQSMVAQAEENLRVVEGRVAAGTAKEIDLSSSKFDLLRMNFAVTNKRIDVLIAQADLARATASEDLK